MDIPITSLYPVIGKDIPASNEDSIGIYDAWSLDDAAHATINMPDGGVTSYELFLIFEYATLGLSKRHSWKITLKLDGNKTQAFTFDMTSPAQTGLSDELLSLGATVDGSQIGANSIVDVQIERISAPSNEDPNDIKIYAYTLRIGQTEIGTSECYGHIGAIIDESRDLFNDWQRQHISDTQILRAINACTRDIAQRGYWVKETEVVVQSGIQSIQLLSHISDLVKPIACYWGDADLPLSPLGSWEELLVLRRQLSSGTPKSWLIRSGALHLFPVPDAPGTIRLWHTYLPPAMGCLANYTLSIPPSFMEAYVYFVLWWAHNRFYADNRMNEAINWRREYESTVEALLEQSYAPPILRPAL